MNSIADMIALTLVVVFVVDLSGWTGTWKAALGRWLGVSVGRVRPFDCSLCMTWWTLLCYLLVTSHMTLWTVALAALLSFSASLIAETELVLMELLKGLVRLLWKLTDKMK